MIYHLTTKAEWEAAQKQGTYLPKGFPTEGFIHCSDHYQLKRVANAFYPTTPELICLKIDTDKLDAPVVYENLEGGTMLFPHIYGGLPVAAVLGTFEILFDADGKRVLPPEETFPGAPVFTYLPLGLPGMLYRSPTPGSRMFDPEDAVFPHIIEADIDVVVVLSPEDETQRNMGGDLFKRYAEAGIAVIHAPSEDFSAPAKGHWDETIAEVIALLEAGKNIVVHCHAGLGRTGMFVACLAQDVLGLSADESVGWVRQYIPWAIDTYLQKQFVREYKQL